MPGLLPMMEIRPGRINEHLFETVDSWIEDFSPLKTLLTLEGELHLRIGLNSPKNCHHLFSIIVRRPLLAVSSTGRRNTCVLDYSLKNDA